MPGSAPDAPEVVTLHLWGIRARQVPWAIGQIARRRSSVARRDAVPGLRFAKMLGTGHGRSFTPMDADPRHWALIASWDTAAQADAFTSGRMFASWDAHSTECWRVRLRPLSSHGRWSRAEPFGRLSGPAKHSGTCAILTRARLRPTKAVAFWRATPPVAADVPDAAGLRFARGIGEAPIGLQATFSVWDDLAHARTFAYDTERHRSVVERTVETGWYAEQLFARFAVIDASGTVDGLDPMADRLGGLRSGAGGTTRLSAPTKSGWNAGTRRRSTPGCLT